MRKTIMLVCALVASATLATAASADNYGGVSIATKNKVMKEVRRYKGWNHRIIECIIRRESGFNPRAINRRDANGGSHGLGQINGIHRYRFAKVWPQRYTIRGGIEMMYRLWLASGYRPWYGGHYGC